MDRAIKLLGKVSLEGGWAWAVYCWRHWERAGWRSVCGHVCPPSLTSCQAKWSGRVEQNQLFCWLAQHISIPQLTVGVTVERARGLKNIFPSAHPDSQWPKYGGQVC